LRIGDVARASSIFVLRMLRRIFSWISLSRTGELPCVYNVSKIEHSH
jgi:hypothetical protein